MATLWLEAIYSCLRGYCYTGDQIEGTFAVSNQRVRCDTNYLYFNFIIVRVYSV